ncbi:MAG: hypothetical protein GY811_05200 [Myxococcales bacterium]|nr:hypothetical protein [Myxococcales bacterium]
MSGSTKTRMIRAYNRMAAPMLFLSGFFQSPPENYHNTEEVEIDIVRSDEDISIAVHDLSTGYRMNSDDIYMNKGFKPPVHKEAYAINSHDLLKRMAGENPFQDTRFQANLITRIYSGMTKIERKIRRSLELQSSQVLQTGIVTLTDMAGEALYTLDYKPKATHFPTAGTSWETATGEEKMADLTALGEVVRNDGLSNPDQLIFGITAFENFISDADVKDRLDTRRIELGGVAPETRGEGATFQGWIRLGNYRYEMWTYDGRYKDPVSGDKLSYIATGNIILRDSKGRMDATYGSIPNIGKLLGAQRTSLVPSLPGRFSNTSGGMDLFTNAWLSADGEQLWAGIGARPLMIPTAIDTYGCLDTQLT